MRLGKTCVASFNSDFWFLRDNGVSVLTAIYMVGEAYKKDIVIVGLPRRKTKKMNEKELESKIKDEGKSTKLKTQKTKMRLGKISVASFNLDYWFLRDNGVSALAAIYIVGEAYKKDIVIVGIPR